MSWTVAHDFAFLYGGAERVTRTIIAALQPEALLVLGGKASVMERMGARSVKTILPSMAVREGTYRATGLLLSPLLRRGPAIDGDLLASSYAFAHWLPCAGRKVVYCHSPLRQVWLPSPPSSRANQMLGALSAPMVKRYRKLDRAAAASANSYIATSRVVRQRIRDFYGLDAAIIPPPIDDVWFEGPAPLSGGDYFLFAGRLVEPYKRVSLLLAAFAEMPRERLVIAGAGRDAERLRQKATTNVEFVGELDEMALRESYRGAEAVLFPSTDDFGLVPVEAMACGTPVIAHSSGGALDTVHEGRSGVFFSELSPAAIARAIDEFRAHEWSTHKVRNCALRYSRHAFSTNFVNAIAGV